MSRYETHDQLSGHAILRCLLLRGRLIRPHLDCCLCLLITSRFLPVLVQTAAANSVTKIDTLDDEDEGKSKEDKVRDVEQSQESLDFAK